MRTIIHFLSYLAQFFLELETLRTQAVYKIKTFYVHKHFSENQGIYEVMWKNSVQPNRPQMTIWRTRMACWMPKGTNAHSEYVILIAFPLQQWLHECASMLRYTYLHCPSYSISL
jgi:hypothetical protein